MEQNNYFLWINIRRQYITYAATNEQSKLLQFRGDPIFGIRFFHDHYSDCHADRCGRKLNWERHLICESFLRRIFEKAILEIDPKFFKRIDNYRYDLCRNINNRYFDDESYKDADFHREYPTIYHLIWELMNSTEAHDVRLVYLACSRLIEKGHTIMKNNEENINQMKDFSLVWDSFISFFEAHGYQIPFEVTQENANILAKILLSKKTPIAKTAAVKKLIFRGKFPIEKEFTKEYPFAIEKMFRLICGGYVDALKLFGEKHQEYKSIGIIALGADEESLKAILGVLKNEDVDFFYVLKAIYDWGEIMKVLGDYESISQSMIHDYEKRKNDLKLLDYLCKKYFDDIRSKHFEHSDPSNYFGSRDYSKSVLFLLNQIQSSKQITNQDQLLIEDILKQIEEGLFMPDNTSSTWNSLPYQLYRNELNKILENARSYLPFLNALDENNVSISDRIKKAMLYRIPQLASPVCDLHSQYSQILCKTNGRILTWDSTEIIDLELRQEAFCYNFIRKCIYCPSEYVLPQNSIIYEKFRLLNEINKIKLDECPISVELKQSIYRDLFLNYRKVTKARIKKYLKEKKGCTFETLTGIGSFNSLETYHDFKEFLDNQLLSEDEIEKIIRHICISENKASLVYWLAREFPHLTEKQIVDLSLFKYKYREYGYYSRKFLCELKCISKKTGKSGTVLSFLWDTNDNLDEILSSNYTFMEDFFKIGTTEGLESELEKANSSSMQLVEKEQESTNFIYNIKLPVCRTLEIIREIVKAEGCAPQKIFIEIPYLRKMIFHLPTDEFTDWDDILPDYEDMDSDDTFDLEGTDCEGTYDPEDNDGDRCFQSEGIFSMDQNNKPLHERIIAPLIRAISFECQRKIKQSNLKSQMMLDTLGVLWETTVLDMSIS